MLDPRSLLTYGAAAAAVALGALTLWQRGEIADGRTALANESAAHARTKEAHAVTLGRLSGKTTELLTDALRVQALMRAAEAERDRQFSKELEHELAEDRRRRGPATRVRITAACPAAAAAPAGGAGLPDLPAAGSVEPAAAEIVGPDRQRVLNLVGAVKTEDVQLRYLQAYAQACAAGLPPPAPPEVGP